MFAWLRNLFSLIYDQAGWTTEMTVTGVADVDSAIPEHWAPSIFADGNRESFWGSLSGKEGEFMPVIDKTGKLKESGDTLRINIIEQLMGSGATGENVLKGNEEKLGVGVMTVTADVVRHAVAISRKSTRQANFDENQRAKSLLTDWMGRKLDADAFDAILTATNIDTLYANSKTSNATLNTTDGDRFGPVEISMIGLALKRLGATPLKLRKVNGRSIPIYGCVFGEVEDYWLNQNTTFVNQIRDSWERFKAGGGDHPLFQGAIGIYRNVILYPYYANLDIPQGTALRPETTLSATLATADTTANVGVAGDSNTKANYTLFFASSGSLQVGTEIISYTGKSVSTFTGLSRGVSSTTAAQHAAGALVTQRNVASVVGFGAQALVRAMPEDVEPIGEKDDYGEQIGIGIRAFYGFKVRYSKRRNKPAAAVVLKCISDNPGTV